MKICITCESSCDLSKQLVEENNIKVLPLIINFSEDSYEDGTEIDTERMFEKIKTTGELPKTAARGIYEYEEFFKETLSGCDGICHLSLSGEFSSSYANACKASEGFENVKVIDSRNLSTGYGLAVLKACDLVKEGKTLDEIVAIIGEYIKRIDASFVINTLKNLYKGGRCSALSMFGANLLKIKPQINVAEGKMQVSKKFMGKMSDVLKKYITEKLSGNDNIDKERIFVTYSSETEFEVEKLVELVRSFGFDNILLTKAGCCISAHCGENSAGVLFAKKV